MPRRQSEAQPSTACQSLSGAGQLLNKEEIRRALNLPSTRMIDELMRKRKIPYIKLGHKTVRFSLPEVILALDNLKISAVSR